jgi:hypothetical protein
MLPRPGRRITEQGRRVEWEPERAVCELNLKLILKSKSFNLASSESESESR